MALDSKRFRDKLKALNDAQKKLMRAEARLAKVKAQKQPRAATLEAKKNAVNVLKIEVLRIGDELRAMVPGNAPAVPADRVPNPSEPTPSTGPAPASSGKLDEATCELVIRRIVDAQDRYIRELEHALGILAGPEDNPHVRAYTRSSRVPAHERGDSRFFGRSGVGR